jgi:hypothetical protein
MKPLKGYERPMPEDSNTSLALEFANFRDNMLQEELEREEELRETISEIETDLELLERDTEYMNPESLYKQLKFLKKKEDSFLFRNTFGRPLPDTVEDIADYSNIPSNSLNRTYEKAFVEDEMDEKEAIKCLKLMDKVERSNMIQLRYDPVENTEEASKEFEQVVYHLNGVSERARDKYRNLSSEIEDTYKDYIREHDELSERDVEWVSPIHIDY